jgi:FkbM family methyltransferase
VRPLRLLFAQAVCRSLPPLISGKARRRLYRPEAGIADDHSYRGRAVTGSELNGRTGEFDGYLFAVHGYTDWRLWAVALAICSEGDTIVEVGANVGTETVGFSDIVGPSGSVVSFEPVPASVDAMKLSLASISHHNVQLLPVAVGDVLGAVQLEVPKNGSHLARVRADNDNSTTSLRVESVTLDSLRDRLGQPSLMIIDVEGSEIAVIRGARALLSEHTPPLVVEANPSSLEEMGFTLEDLRSELTALGYSIWRLSRLGLSEPRLGWFKGYENWFCTTDASLAASVRTVIRRAGTRPCVPWLNPLTRPRFRRGRRPAAV